jgi:hypothetical protein
LLVQAVQLAFAVPVQTPTLLHVSEVVHSLPSLHAPGAQLPLHTPL